MSIHPQIDRGQIRITYYRVLPGAQPLAGSGFKWWRFAYTSSWDNRYKAGAFVERNLYAPMSSAMALALVYPSVKAVRFVRGPLRRSRWRQSGRCEQCGYDLTGNVSGICPECGSTAQKAA